MSRPSRSCSDPGAGQEETSHRRTIPDRHTSPQSHRMGIAGLFCYNKQDGKPFSKRSVFSFVFQFACGARSAFASFNQNGRLQLLLTVFYWQEKPKRSFAASPDEKKSQRLNLSLLSDIIQEKYACNPGRNHQQPVNKNIEDETRSQ
ncbi:MAG: hypothetical protein K5919_07915 [Clostridiales bacterium]|nr:hypothetical protein [Clostridiales bacterium]